MLRIGRKKVTQGGLEAKVDLKHGIAEDLSQLDDASIDAAIVSFGVRNFQDREKGLREIARVLKPGAKFSILEITGDPQQSIPVVSFFRRLFISKMMPLLGGVISGHPKMYRYDSFLSSPFQQDPLVSHRKEACTEKKRTCDSRTAAILPARETGQVDTIPFTSAFPLLIRFTDCPCRSFIHISR